jgi:hypothetical protein
MNDSLTSIQFYCFIPVSLVSVSACITPRCRAVYQLACRKQNGEVFTTWRVDTHTERRERQSITNTKLREIINHYGGSFNLPRSTILLRIATEWKGLHHRRRWRGLFHTIPRKCFVNCGPWSESPQNIFKFCEVNTSPENKNIIEGGHRSEEVLSVSHASYMSNFFLICIVGSGVQTGSTRHVGHLLAYCTCPGWLWGWIIWWNEWQEKPK